MSIRRTKYGQALSDISEYLYHNKFTYDEAKEFADFLTAHIAFARFDAEHTGFEYYNIDKMCPVMREVGSMPAAKLIDEKLLDSQDESLQFKGYK